MNTITVWLLISLGSNEHGFARPTMVVERFADATECQRVASVLNASRPIHQCVQAKVVRP